MASGRYMRLAHAFVTTAIYHGDLPKLDGSVQCADCNAPAVEYDHRDYRKPLEVDPVCKACNAARGPGLFRDPGGTNKRPTLRKRFDRRVAAAIPAANDPEASVGDLAA